MTHLNVKVNLPPLPLSISTTHLGTSFLIPLFLSSFVKLQKTGVEGYVVQCCAAGCGWERGAAVASHVLGIARKRAAVTHSPVHSQ